jgi:peptidyl-prolyl cis-trans isomerase D
MFKFLRKHKTVVFVTLAAVMIGLPFFGVGGFTFFSPQDSIVKVNGKRIIQREYDILLNQLVRQVPNMTPERRVQLEQEAFQELIRREVLFQEALRYGIYVSDQEVALNLFSIPSFQTEGKFDPRKYAQTLSQVFRMTPKEFEGLRRKEMAAMKLNQIIASSARVDPQLVKDGLKRRIEIEVDPEKKKELKKNPDIYRGELRDREIQLVFADWLSQINSKLKVSFVSESFRKRLQGGG